MNVVIAIDSFKGSMTSMQAGLSAATGIKRVYKDAHITVRPLADGGEGTVDALVNGCDGRMTQVPGHQALPATPLSVLTALSTRPIPQSLKCPVPPGLPRSAERKRIL